MDLYAKLKDLEARVEALEKATLPQPVDPWSEPAILTVDNEGNGDDLSAPNTSTTKPKRTRRKA